jgi:hypothetical protein
MSLLLLGAGAATLALTRSVYIRLDRYEADSIKINKNKSGSFEEIVKNPRKKYGLILSHTPSPFFSDKVYPILPDFLKEMFALGYFKDRFANTAKIAYETLISRGYAKEDLFVLEGRKVPSKRFDGNTLPFDKKSLDDVLKYLSKEIKPDDAFFMMVSAHGGKILPLPGMNINQSSIMLNDDENPFIYEKEFEKMLSALNPNYSVLFFNSCFGNDFAQRFAKGRTVTISAARPNKAVMISGEDNNNLRFGSFCGSFSLGFLSALQKKFPDNTLIEKLKGYDDLESAFDFGTSFEREAYTRFTDTYVKAGSRLRRVFLSLIKNTPYLYYDKINPSEIQI